MLMSFAGQNGENLIKIRLQKYVVLQIKFELFFLQFWCCFEIPGFIKIKRNKEMEI